MDVFVDDIEIVAIVDGSIPEGFLFASVKNEGPNIANVNGIPLEVGQAKSYPFAGKGHKQIDYVVNSSTLTVMYTI